MKNHIINAFIFYDKLTYNNIYNYVSNQLNNINKKLLKKNINILITNDTLTKLNEYYELTHKGEIIKNDNIYYNISIITKYYKKYQKVSEKLKKYGLKEVRPEQNNLRKYLIENKPHECFICNKKLPLCLLETAHLKPRHILNDKEKLDNNIVEFFCRYCHTLYDEGLISINENILMISEKLNNYDLEFINLNFQLNKYNKKYFNYHINNIFLS